MADINLSEVIHNPSAFLIDGKPVVRARLEVFDSSGFPVVIHQWDHGLQEKRITPAAGVTAQRIDRTKPCPDFKDCANPDRCRSAVHCLKLHPPTPSGVKGEGNG